jgi:cleavage and polyadenylation specificity factor subunit 3
MEITTLGAGSEVGRSCILLKYKGKTIMLDCGVHPAYSGENSLPLYQNIDVTSVDLLLVSHFHLDHAGALPNFLEKTNFAGAVYMTHPTKAITKMILMDFIKVSHTPDDLTLFSEEQIASAMRKIKTVHYHEEIVHKGIKFWSYNAGHVLGAAMFMIEIDGARVLYTGDYSRQEDRHLKAAELPDLKPHVLIVESTYGTQNHESKQAREESFIKSVHDTVIGGGRVLLPTFALGRAQELLLILDEHWRANAELRDIPIYFATSLGKRCMVVYQTYVDMMVDKIQKRLAYDNPFVFKYIRNLLSVDKFHDTGPCVVMASPGMLQSGLSRDLFERWCSDSRNTVILSGYSVEGTLASEISKETQSQTIVSLKTHRNLPLRMKVHTMSFSAHVDYAQNASFVRELQPTHIVLVHGAVDQMRAFKRQIVEYFPKEKVHAPRNLESVHINFELNRTCLLFDDESKDEFRADQVKEEEAAAAAAANKMETDDPAAAAAVDIGSDPVASSSGAHHDKAVEHHDGGGAESGETQQNVTGQQIHGVLLVKNFDHKLIDISDLHYLNESGLVTTTVSQRMRIPLGSIKFEDIPHHIGQLFSELEGPFEEDGRRTIIVNGTVKLLEGDNKQLLIRWTSTAIDDMVVDSIMAVLAHVEANPFAITPASSASDSKPKATTKAKGKAKKSSSSKSIKADDENLEESSSTSHIESAKTQRGVLGSLPADSSPLDQLNAILPFLKHQFTSANVDPQNLTLTVTLDDDTATFNYNDRFVTSSSPLLEDRLNTLLDNIAAVVLPLTV